MGEKFKDFPCFYYLENRVNKKYRIQFYSMLASMFGQTPEQAAQNSELFAHASGKLFGGTGYSIEEIQANAGNYFEKPYKDCRGFYRRKAFDESGLKDNCCVTCPYSNSYLNNCLDAERQILRILSERRDLFGLTDCSTGDFKSRIAISCSNDLSEYPIVPFNAYLFEYLVRNDGLIIEDIASFVNDAMLNNGLFVSEDKLLSFVNTQIGIISRIDLPGGDCTSALLYALNCLREAHYVPPQFVHPASQTKPSKKNSKKEQLAASAQEGLARLISDIEGVRFVDKKRNEEDFSVISHPIAEEETCHVANDTENSSVPSLFSIPTVAPTFDDTDALQAECLTVESVASDLEYEKTACANDNTCDDESTPSIFSIHTNNNAFSFDASELLICDDAEITDSESDSLTEQFSCEDEYGEVADDGLCEGVSVVTITPLPDNSIEEGAGPVLDELDECLNNESVDSCTENKDDAGNSDIPDLIYSNPCCICHGVTLEDYPYSEDWLRGILRHCEACENAVAKDNEKPFCSSALTHPIISTGCAFSNNEPEAACIYGDVPMTLSEEFASIISDCSDYACSLSNLVSFVEACDTASSVSVECVNIYGIDGLLFYVTGAYYFIGGGTSACAAMKKLFSNADKLKLYSLNPLLVHVKLLRFGLRHVKIESLSVRYSVFVGTDLLLPPSVMFVTGDGSDMYRTIMPQYEKLFERTALTGEETKRYEKLMRLEWALAASVDTSFIALGSNRSVYGSNALNYWFSLLDVGKICREGTLYVVTLDEDSKIPLNEEKLFWEDVAGRLASSSLSCMNYSFILGLGKGISYFTCFEEEAFFDSLMASARSAYKKAYKREVHLQVTREKYVTY